MTPTLYYHPLASFCHKVLIALYENDTPFERRIVDLGDAAERAAFQALWPMARMPVLRDAARGRTIPETSIIIEYLDRYYPGTAPLLPIDPDLALEARHWDRFHDLYVQEPMQKIVTDTLRPEGDGDAFGVAHARTVLATAYDVIEAAMAGRTWAVGTAFSIADCAAAPALFYAEKVLPFGANHAAVAGYSARLRQRPSFARVLEEARPYFAMFPG